VKYLTLLLLIPCILFAEDIHLKNGSKYTNVTISDSTGSFYKLALYPNGVTKISKSDVEKIIYTPVDIKEPSVISSSINNAMRFENNTNSEIAKNYSTPNLKLLPISLLAGLLVYDYFSDAGDIQDQIDAYAKLKLNTDDLDSKKSRKTIMGITCVVVAVINTVISFQHVEIEANQDKVALNYKYQF
jgi:hypothetical protein